MDFLKIDGLTGIRHFPYGFVHFENIFFLHCGIHTTFIKWHVTNISTAQNMSEEQLSQIFYKCAVHCDSLVRFNQYISQFGRQTPDHVQQISGHR